MPSVEKRKKDLIPEKQIRGPRLQKSGGRKSEKQSGSAGNVRQQRTASASAPSREKLAPQRASGAEKKNQSKEPTLHRETRA
jgi:hypothetical protein